MLFFPKTLRTYLMNDYKYTDQIKSRFLNILRNVTIYAGGKMEIYI